MSDPVLQGIADDLKSVGTEIERARTLIAVAEEAGENVAQLKSELRTAESRKNKWTRALELRGVRPAG